MSTARAALILSVLACGLASARAAAQQPAQVATTALGRALAAPTDEMARAHLRFLSDDLLEGRAPGTPGGDLAARYIASQFELLGLAPGAADGSYFQPVDLVGMTPEPSLVLGAGAHTSSIDFLTEFVAWPARPEESMTVDGDVVFVGYGIEAPEWNWDDYKSTSMTGKILLMLVNDPGFTDSSRFNGRALTYYGRWTYKLEQAARLGAIGAILIHTDESATYPWSVIRNSWSGEQIQLDRPVQESLRFGAWMTEEAAREMLAAGGRDYDLLVRRAQRPEFRPIPLDAHAVVHIRSEIRRMRSVNVVARAPGGDAERAREAVVITAHYDHLGVGIPVDGDSIYNGALDNASGVAALLAVGAGLAVSGPSPRRAIVLVATTAEESGLLGAQAYTRAPPVPLEHTAAAINIDRANLWGVANDAVALGAERSEILTYVDRAWVSEGVERAPDPSPHAGHFYRSDHLAFARAGIPVVSLRAGSSFANRPPDWGVEREGEYVARHYHQPSDEFRDDFEYAGLLQQVRLLLRLAWELAATSDYPAWGRDSEFRPAGEQLRLKRLREATP
jgi:Zn-dependent M28 family amino/carboxypeptidase